jgi:protein TonB
MKSSSLDMHSMRGAVAPKLIAVLALLVIAGAGAWWFLGRGDNASAPVAAPETSETEPTDPSGPLPVISPAVEELSVDQLSREARKAMAEQRLVMPAGNNALEYYLAILEKDPSNAGAQEALRELFPFASGTAEQEINQGDIEEASRIILSLAKADPSNYTLTILRSKLDAKRKSLEQQQAQAAAAVIAQTRPASTAPVEQTPAATSPAATPATAQTAPATTPATTAAAPVETAPPPVAQPTRTAATGETRDVSVIAPAAPVYPPQAARNRAEGWVEVEFTVTADGSVQGARVTRSDPPRLFDREAIRSIERSTFRPRLESGTPVDSTVRRRIEFKLGG